MNDWGGRGREEQPRGKQNKPRRGQRRKERGGLGGSRDVFGGAAECARSVAMWHRQAAAKRKAGWFIRRAAPDTASHSPVPPAFMEGLPDGSDSTIRAMAEPRQFLLHCLITLHARAESQWLWQPHQHNNNNSIVMNDCVFWSRGGNKVMPGHNATWKLNKDYYLKFTTFSYRFRESCWRSRSFEGWILSWQSFLFYLHS